MKVVLIATGFVLFAGIVVGPARSEKLSEQTVVQVRLVQDVKSGHSRKGEAIHFEVAADVLGAGKDVLLPAGTPVVGTVTRSSGRGMFGKPGKLEFTIDYIKWGDSTRIPLRSTAVGGRGRNNSAAAITSAVLLAPIAVFVKGREVKFPKGKEFTVYVDQTTDLAPMTTASVPAVYNANKLSFIRFKDGSSLIGTVVELKNCIYTVATGLGSLQVHEDKVESVKEHKIETAK